MECVNCKSSQLVKIIDIGSQPISSVFPAEKKYDLNVKGAMARMLTVLIKVALNSQQRLRSMEGALQDVWTLPAGSDVAAIGGRQGGCYSEMVQDKT